MSAVGVDLGTTNTAVARVLHDEHSLAHPTLLRNRAGEITTPSVVFFDGERPVVGHSARLAATVAPDDYVELVKRHMGDPAWRFATAEGTTYTAEEISSLILRHAVLEAEHTTGTPCSEAVITVPAYFDDARRRATARAGGLAGLDVLRILNEPTAAALAFGYTPGAGLNPVDRHVLVYDLGGGTFDVTLVRISGDEFRVISTAGDRNLGGFDFDNALMRYVDEQATAAGHETSLDGELAEAVLRDRCEQAKRSLTTLPEASVMIEPPHAHSSVPVTVTRSVFEEITAPLLKSTEEILIEVLEEARIDSAEISNALLVGGSTRMPMVHTMVERVTGARVDRSVHPDEAVALGAALIAEELSSRRSTRTTHTPRTRIIGDVTAHGVGVIARSAETGAEINSVVIERNTLLPARGVRRFHTLAENQPEILIVVTEGDDDNPMYVSIVGSARVRIPPASSSHETTGVEVHLEHSEEGLIDVRVLCARSGEELGEFSIDRQERVDAADIERMRSALGKLEHH